MEWDQITDRWAAMTYRLRGNTTPEPKADADRLPPGLGAPLGLPADPQSQMTSQLFANDRNQPSRQ